eukprot:COSAG04_NODE_434_length_14479_cov_52.278164_15_plen_54_part_01
MPRWTGDPLTNHGPAQRIRGYRGGRLPSGGGGRGGGGAVQPAQGIRGRTSLPPY